MKRIATVAVLMLCGLCYLTSCGPNVVGKYANEKQKSVILELKKDGKWTITVSLGDQPGAASMGGNITVNGTYKVKGKEIKLKPEMEGAEEVGGTIDGKKLIIKKDNTEDVFIKQ
jgi:hypothetical protein